MKTLLSIVRHYAGVIKNGRTPEDVQNHLESEVKELRIEVEALRDGRPQGSDGVVGEAIDVIQCGLDLILQVRPEITEEEMLDIMGKKCEKWRLWYSESIHKSQQPLEDTRDAESR